MGSELHFIDSVHSKSLRDYVGRMQKNKVENMTLARKFGVEFFDGHRDCGYGGYSYIPGWFTPLIDQLIERYNLNNRSRVLDVGCGKGFFLHELTRSLPGISVQGFDISEYGISNCVGELSDSLFVHDASDPFPFNDQEFDLVVSLGTLHNLTQQGLDSSLSEIKRVALDGYIVVDAFDDEGSLFNLECWALTATIFFSADDWRYVFKRSGFDFDFDFLYYR